MIKRKNAAGPGCRDAGPGRRVALGMRLRAAARLGPETPGAAPSPASRPAGTRRGEGAAARWTPWGSWTGPLPWSPGGIRTGADVTDTDPVATGSGFPPQGRTRTPGFPAVKVN